MIMYEVYEEKNGVQKEMSYRNLPKY